MSQGPRGRFNDVLSQVITGQTVPGSEILAIIGMFRERSLREQFLMCLHIKAPYLRLSRASYLTLVDLLRTLLREANNSGDYRCGVTCFSLAQHYGVTNSGVVLTVLQSLCKHEAWSNINFWMYATEELIMRDIDRWNNLSSKHKQFIPLEDKHMYVLFAISRVQSIVFSSMRAVCVSVDFMSEYIETAMRAYALSMDVIDITVSPCREYVVWLMDLAIMQYLSTANCSLDTSESNRSNTGSGSYKFDTRLRSVELGYSALQELLLSVGEKQAGNLSNASSKAGSMHSTASSAATTIIDSCVCGSPVGTWQPLGVSDSEFGHRVHASNVLCERCFRAVMASPLNIGDAPPEIGRCVVPMLPPLRPATFQHIYYGLSSRAPMIDLGSLGNQLAAMQQYHKVNSFKIRFDSTDEHDATSECGAIRISDSTEGGSSDNGKAESGPRRDIERVWGIAAGGEQKPHGKTPKYTLAWLHLLILIYSRMELSRFVSMLQAGIDVIKITNKPIVRHYMRTIFIDKTVTFLCWLPPGK